MCKTTLIIPFLREKWNEKLVNNFGKSNVFSKVIHVPYGTQKFVNKGYLQASTSFSISFHV